MSEAKPSKKLHYKYAKDWADSNGYTYVTHDYDQQYDFNNCSVFALHNLVTLSDRAVMRKNIAEFLQKNPHLYKKQSGHYVLPRAPAEFIATTQSLSAMQRIESELDAIRQLPPGLNEDEFHQKFILPQKLKMQKLKEKINGVLPYAMNNTMSFQDLYHVEQKINRIPNPVTSGQVMQQLTTYRELQHNISPTREATNYLIYSNEQFKNIIDPIDSSKPSLSKTIATIKAANTRNNAIEQERRRLLYLLALETQ